jgi:uncharacterized protein (DUF2249 family)
MKVDANTKISKILKASPKAIEIITNINPKFEKLNNPILRRSLATRVSVKDAAKIGKIDVNDFLKKLEENGFEVEYYNEKDTGKVPEKKLLPPDFSNREIIELDVRPIMEEGKDPFAYINKVAKQIKPEQILLIINDFEPIPLIDFLVSKNFIHWMKQDEQGNYLTYFKLNCKKPGLLKRIFGKNVPCQYHSVNKEDNKQPEEKKQPEVNTKDFDKIKEQFKGKLKEVDVRDLEMPLPMKTVLEEIENLEPNQALLVHHKRIPQFLLPELEKRNYKITAKEINPDYTYLIIYK